MYVPVAYRLPRFCSAEKMLERHISKEADSTATGCLGSVESFMSELNQVEGSLFAVLSLLPCMDLQGEHLRKFSPGNQP